MRFRALSKWPQTLLCKYAFWQIFANFFKDLQWITSDVENEHPAIKEWLAEAKVKNIHGPEKLKIGEDDFPNRQIEIYDNGRILKNSQDNLENEYGGLGDQKIDLSEFDGIECPQKEFEDNWNQ